VLEAVGLAVALSVLCAIAFRSEARHIGSGMLPVVLYLPLPLLVWSAVRFGALGASGAILLLTVTLLWRTLQGPSPFIADTPEASVFAMQAFLTSLAVPLLLLGAAIDEARSAQRAIQASEARMAFAAVAADLGLWHFNIRTEDFWITDHGRRMLGLPEDEPVTRTMLLEIIHPDDRDSVQSYVHSAAQSNRFIVIEFRILRRDGTQRWLRARARAEQAPAGETIEISGTFADITSLKQAELELAQQQREVAHLMRVAMLGELSGGIAHELTQPLAAIMANAQAIQLMLNSKAAELPEITAALDEIIREDRRAGEVIHRVRSLLTAGEGKVEPVDLNELARSSLRLMHGELVARRIRCQCDFADALPLTSGDPVQLQQVLLNLLMNAAEAMHDVPEPRRRVVVRTTGTEDGRVCLAISDSGPGLPADRHADVLQPFFTTKEQGLGLGLAVCASIVTSHGGTLKLQSNESGGATATVLMPVTTSERSGSA
jgi:PAS domain S-box-containing protein